MSSTASSDNATPSSPGSKKNVRRSVEEKRVLVERNHPTISVKRQAELLGLSRSSVYRIPEPPSEEDLELLAALDRLYTAHPYYGGRRLSVVLRNDHGIEAGRDAIRSAMRTLGLQTLYPKPKTSVPHPSNRIYPYLLRGVRAEDPNHVWGTDITYLPLSGGYAYLVAILDWFSRYVVAWRISDSLKSGFCVETLHAALETGRPRIHNSDQGTQFTSESYTDLLKEMNVAISMDGRGRCLDNIFTERLWRTLKYEDVYLKGYATIGEAREGIGAYLRFYNEKRPHQSLNYKTPAEIYFSSTRA